MRLLTTLMLIVPLAACSAGDAAHPPIMFRGDPAHTGVSTQRLFAGQGGIKWRVTTGGPVRSTPAVTPTRVFAGSGDGFLYALDRATGRIVWRFDAGSAVDASPAVAGGLIVCATKAGRVFAVGERDGAVRWSLDTGPLLPPNTAPAGGWDLWVSSPVIVGDTVVIGGQDGGVYALDLPSGRQIWKAQTGGRVRATPAVEGGVVVVGSWDGRVYALDLATGAVRWVHRTEGDTLDSRAWGFDRRAIQGSAALAGGMVFVGSRDGALYGLDLRTGERRWRATHRGSWVIGSPSVAGGRVIVGSSDGHFINAVRPETGEDLWRLATEANVIASPLVIGDLVVVGTHRTDAAFGDLLALDAATGRVRWRLRMDEAVDASPVAEGGELYLGTAGGGIVAVHEVLAVVPRLAVYYDSTTRARPASQGGALAFTYFRDLGYEPLGADAVNAFLAARIADTVPSAVVFASDVLPDTALIRGYLASGGKIVAFSFPLGSAVRDSTGRVLGDDPHGMERLLGVPAAALDYDEDPSMPTASGRRWGLDVSVRGDYPLTPGAVSEVLATDAAGRATAWVKNWRADRPGSGYVQLWGLGATIDRLPSIRAAAEYGLLRAAR